jgi:hypothetical protein
VLAVQLVAEAERVEGQEQVHLADAELDVAASRALLPAEQSVTAEVVGLLLGVVHAVLVDPTSEVGAHAHVGRQRDEAPAHLVVGAEAGEEPAEHLLRADGLGAHGGGDGVGQGERGPGARRHVVHLGTRRGGEPPGRAVGGEPVPLGVEVEADLAPQLVDLGGAQQRGVVERVAGDRQPPTLHGVGEHHARPVVGGVARAVAVEQQSEVVAAEVLHERHELVVGDVGDEAVHGGVRVVEERGPQVGAAQREQRLVPLVAHLVDVAAQRVAAVAGERRLEEAAVLRLHDVPAGALEELHELLDLLPGDDAVEALAVGVDDEHHVAQALQRGVGDRLPHVALVELRVADEGDEAGGLLARSEVALHVAAGHRGEQRSDHAEPHRTGGEVGDVGVLGAARVALQAAELAQAEQVVASELALQVLDGVEHR